MIPDPTRPDRITTIDGTTLADGLTFEEARREHRRLSERHEAHFWMRWTGPRAGYACVAGLFEASDNVNPPFPSAVEDAGAIGLAPASRAVA